MTRSLPFALAALLVLIGCNDAASGEVIVSVIADGTVSARLKVVEARLFASESERTSPALVRRFVAQDGNGSKLAFPLSLRHTHAGRPLRVELRGYEADAPQAPVAIERKEIVRLSEPDENAFVTLVLGAACLEAARVCSDAQQTCAPDGPSAGKCIALPDATALPTPDVRPTSSVGLDASVADAEVRPDAAVLVPEGDGTSPTELPPEALAACPVPAPACQPEHPCVPSSDGLGYACRGQFADWPMPDAELGAKTKPRYEVRPADRTVHDLVTGLLWQQQLPARYRGCGPDGSDADDCTLDGATRYCSQLLLAGHRWRLPSRIELESLVDHTVPNGQALIDPVAFPSTPRTYFWTTSRWENTGAAMRLIVAKGIAAPVEASTRHAVRCVRSERIVNAPPGERYVSDAANQTLRDRHTTLEWSVAKSPVVATLDAAVAHCRSLPGGFRVPTLKELSTLSNPGARPALTPGFPEPGFDFFSANGVCQWTTTPVIGNAGTFVYVPRLGLASPGGSGLSCEPQVRCVR